ncbi:uncharacterized protein [Ptychodera flava]|uniref:uncharacterized protein isoform X1 n=1 Tax=Ptychodera flava TaxID=63121 RepID=UPI00396A2BDB
MDEADSAIASFLEPLDLMQYLEVFQTKGYDKELDICNLTHNDLDELGITDDDHRGMILDAAEHHELSDVYRVYQFLKEYELDYYYKHFIACDYTTLDSISRMIVDEDSLDDLEITLPGHKRRLQVAVSSLRKRRRTSETEPESPVAIGYWGKPTALVDAKYDFICLKSTIKSTKPDKPTFNLEFMVDSGSDVVTVRQDILDQLDLELIGTIQSRGVHATVEKQLYRAVLGIGKFDIEIEVMAEPYESIGNRALRYFRHFIDQSRHIWLQPEGHDISTSSLSSFGESPPSAAGAAPPGTSAAGKESTPPGLSRVESSGAARLTDEASRKGGHAEETPREKDGGKPLSKS